MSINHSLHTFFNLCCRIPRFSSMKLADVYRQSCEIDCEYTNARSRHNIGPWVCRLLLQFVNVTFGENRVIVKYALMVRMTVFLRELKVESCTKIVYKTHNCLEVNSVNTRDTTDSYFPNNERSLRNYLSN